MACATRSRRCSASSTASSQRPMAVTCARTAARAALCLCLLPGAARASLLSLAEEAPSAITLPAGTLSPEAPGVRKVLEDYIRAVEARDVQMFRRGEDSRYGEGVG